jgi:hypothetical protein
MTVPNDDGFVGASVTEDQFKQNLVQLLDHIRSLTSGFDLKNGKVYDFASILDFEAIKTKIPAGSIVVIEWGEEYGAYVWDGTNLTKSQYDLLALAKSDATAKAATAKSEAISAAATDASTKAQSAETNAKLAAENTDVKLLTAIQQIIDAVTQFRTDYDIDLATLPELVNSNDTQVNTRITRLLVALQQVVSTISDNRDDIDSIISTLNSAVVDNSNTSLNTSKALQIIVQSVMQLNSDLNDAVLTEAQKLANLTSTQNLFFEFFKLDGFDPNNVGTNKYIEAEKNIFLPTPQSVIRIDVDATDSLPTAKGTVINTLTAINVDGQIVKNFGTLEVQGSSSAAFPKKNWTLCLFSDEARTTALKIKIGEMIVQEEFVFKANFVDNTHTRNIAVNRLYDEMQMSRSGFPKREVDSVNMLNSDLSVENYNGLKYAPTGATGHVDGFPAVVYINGFFYGIGTLNIGKKRDNYNLDKNNQKHIQLEPEGSVNLYSLPADPTIGGLGNFEIRRPSSWGSDAQASYDRLRTFLSMSRTDMQNAGIDNYINRAQMQDYIILCQVCDLWDHLHKNTLYTTWDGMVWNFMPYDLDTVFGLHFLGNYFNADGTSLHPADALRVPAASADNNWGTLAKFRLIYDTDIDARYAALRKAKIIDVDHIVQLCESILRKFPQALLEAENSKWNTGSTSIYTSLQQTGSIHQIQNWLTQRMPIIDAYFNYTA